MLMLEANAQSWMPILYAGKGPGENRVFQTKKTQNARRDVQCYTMLGRRCCTGMEGSITGRVKGEISDGQSFLDRYVKEKIDDRLYLGRIEKGACAGSG